MEKYIIIKKNPNGTYKIKYIYYGNIWNGLSVSKNVRIRNKIYKHIEKIFNTLTTIAIDKPEQQLNIKSFLKKRKIKRRVKCQD